jgi:hypothetical protein
VGGTCSTHGEMRSAYKTLVGKLGDFWFCWEDNNNIYFQNRMSGCGLNLSGSG